MFGLLKMGFEYVVDVSKYTAGMAAAIGITDAMRASVTLLNDIVRESARVILEQSMAYERNALAFTVMVGSYREGMNILERVTNLAIETPFQSEELILATRQIKSFGIENENIIPVLSRLGDVAAGTGTPLFRIVLAYGQIMASGRLMGQELRQLTEAGIPILQYLSEILDVPKQSVRNMVEEGMVGSNAVVEAFNRMTSAGGLYANMMIKLGQTVSGRWDALRDKIKLAARDIGTAFFEAFNVAQLLDKTGDTIGEQISKNLSGLSEFFSQARVVYDGVYTIFEQLLTKLRTVLEQIFGGFNFSFESAKNFVTEFGKYAPAELNLIYQVTKGIAQILLHILDNVVSIVNHFVNKGDPTKRAVDFGPKSTFLGSIQEEGEKFKARRASGASFLRAYFDEGPLILEAPKKALKTLYLPFDSDKTLGQRLGQFLSNTPLGLLGAELGYRISNTEGSLQPSPNSAGSSIAKAVGAAKTGIEQIKEMMKKLPDEVFTPKDGDEVSKAAAEAMKNAEKLRMSLKNYRLMSKVVSEAVNQIPDTIKQLEEDYGTERWKNVTNAMAKMAKPIDQNLMNQFGRLLNPFETTLGNYIRLKNDPGEELKKEIVAWDVAKRADFNRFVEQLKAQDQAVIDLSNQDMSPVKDVLSFFNSNKFPSVKDIPIVKDMTYVTEKIRQIGDTLNSDVIPKIKAQAVLSGEANKYTEGVLARFKEGVTDLDSFNRRMRFMVEGFLGPNFNQPGFKLNEEQFEFGMFELFRQLEKSVGKALELQVAPAIEAGSRAAANAFQEAMRTTPDKQDVQQRIADLLERANMLHEQQREEYRAIAKAMGKLAQDKIVVKKAKVE